MGNARPGPYVPSSQNIESELDVSIYGYLVRYYSFKSMVSRHLEQYTLAIIRHTMQLLA